MLSHLCSTNGDSLEFQGTYLCGFLNTTCSHKKFIFGLICSTPDMSRINGDETEDLRVVARVLKDVIGVCNLTPYIKLGCIMLMIVKPPKCGWQVLSRCPN